MKRGFTLIELLVVVAIIGMLSSVVLSSLNQARANARTASVQQQLTSLQSALELYHSANGQYPGGGVFGACDNGNETVLDAASGIAPYVGGTVPEDPWGNYYMVDGDYQCGAATVGCQGVADPAAISGVLFSAGPNGGTNYGDGDDIVIVLCKR